MSADQIDDWLDAGRRALSEGKLKQARSLFDRVLALSKHPAALHLKGATLLQQGQASAAVELIEQAVAGDARADYFCDLGTAYYILRDRTRSEAAYRHALELDAHHLDASYNLANLLRERKRTAEALTLYSAVLEAHPEHELAWNNCGLALLDLKQPAEARQCFGQVLQVNPKNLQALLNLANLLRDDGELDGAIELYELGLGIDSRDANLLLNLGNTLLGAGRVAEAVANLRRAVESDPRNDAAHSALIFSLDFDPRATTADHQQARRKWYQQCIAPRRIAELNAYRNPDPARKLRIGYVSADFRASSAAMGFGAVLFNHDRSRFEIFCYANGVAQDGMTRQFRQHADGWRDISGRGDEEAAALIASDAIDILVDLSGHMQGHRLGVFAHKPAPIQISAWGYAHGTGLPQMDCMFSDPIFIPEAERKLFTERIVDLPSVISYRPLDALPELTPAPAATRGHVTFSCFNRRSKISTRSIELWAKLLERLPNARLLLKSARRSDESALQSVLAHFARLGIDPSRVGMLPHAQWTAHMQSYAEVDIALDPYPHSGGISLIEGLLMGVPTLAMRGHTMSSRLAQALLHAADLDDWCADSDEAFIDLAVGKCADLEGLGKLRAELRQRTLGSSLGDNSAYTAAVEARYRELWIERSAILAKQRDGSLHQARTALMRSDASAALAILEPMIAGDGTDAAALHLAGIAHFQSGNASAALKALRRASSLAPDNVDVHVDLSTVLADLERVPEAISELNRALDLAPEHGIAHYNLANLLMGLRRLDDAEQHYQQAVRLLPNDAKVVNNLGIVYERRGDTQRARALFEQALQLQPEFAQAHENIGRLLVEHDEMQPGIERYERALALQPDLHHLRYELLVWYDRLGWHHKLGSLAGLAGKKATRLDVRTAFDAITARVKSDIALRQRRPARLEDQLMQFCARLMELGHPGKIWLLEEILSLNPDNLVAYQQLGICHYHDCRYAQARSFWAAGLNKRDELAQRNGLSDKPFRLLDASWYQAVGHIALLDTFIKARKLGWLEDKPLYLLRVAGQKIVNQTYLDYWQPHVRMLEPNAEGSNIEAVATETGMPPARFSQITEPLWATKLSSGQTLWHIEFAAAVQREWEARGGAPLLTLSEPDDVFGSTTLEQLGLPAGAWFVCFHIREPGFWWKWNRFHASTRDADAQTYVQAMQAVVARGGWVVRMGDPSMKVLPSMPGVIDYAHSAFKSERMDVYLSARCRFFVGVNSGLSFLPSTFGRPCVLTNFTPLSVPFPYSADIVVPKMFRRRGSERFICIEELFASKLADAQFQNRIPGDVEVVDNDPEEICDAVLEMLDELEGKLSAAQMDDAVRLRKRFDDLVLRHEGFLGSRIAGSFLRRHRELL